MNQIRTKLKKGDSVIVTSGKDKGKSGSILSIFPRKNRAIVKGINIVKKHEKTTKEKKGGIISKENFIHISNLKNLDIKAKEKNTGSKKWYQDLKNSMTS